MEILTVEQGLKNWRRDVEDSWRRNAQGDLPQNVAEAMWIVNDFCGANKIGPHGQITRIWGGPSHLLIGYMRQGIPAEGWMKKCHPNSIRPEISEMEETILHYKMSERVAEAFRLIISDMQRWDVAHPDAMAIRYRTLRDKLMDAPRSYHG